MPKDLRKAYDSLFLLVSLLVWKERNSRVFDRFATMPAWLMPKINLEPGQWVAAGFRRLMPLFDFSFVGRKLFLCNFDFRKLCAFLLSFVFFLPQQSVACLVYLCCYHLNEKCARCGRERKIKCMNLG